MDDIEGRGGGWEYLPGAVRNGLHAFYPVFDQVRRVSLAVLKKRGNADAEDLAEDVVIAALHCVEQDRHYFDGRSVVGWARAAALNAASKWAAKHTAGESNETAFVVEQATARQEATDPLMLVWRSELGERIDRAMASLDEQHRAVALAILRDGYSPQETASRLGLSVRTVGEYLRSARAVLQRQLQSTFNHYKQ